ncbi:MAG: ribonuclease [Mogibacterium sp.]|nr:ribonuclease [Mogibacterium sp.]
MKRSARIIRILITLMLIAGLVFTVCSCGRHKKSEAAEPDTGSVSSIEYDDTDSGTIREDGEYTTAQDVAEYIHTYHKLPPNYVTKDEAYNYGWKGDKCPADYGIMIGGMKFGNREKLLPKGKYRECDVDYNGDRRGTCRLVYTQDGIVYHTQDHYKSFTRLY